MNTDYKDMNVNALIFFTEVFLNIFINIITITENFNWYFCKQLLQTFVIARCVKKCWCYYE